MTFSNILQVHIIVVSLYLLFILIKVYLLLTNNFNGLDKFRKKTIILESLFGLIFLVTGIWLALTSAYVPSMWFYVKVVAVLAVIPLGIIGFKKKKKVLGVLSLVVLLYIYGSSETHSPIFKKDKVDVTKIDHTDRALMYAQLKCDFCHGVDGTLGRSGAANLQTSKIDFMLVRDIVKNGKGAMPKHTDLGEDQLDDIAQYVVSLRK